MNSDIVPFQNFATHFFQMLRCHMIAVISESFKFFWARSENGFQKRLQGRGQKTGRNKLARQS